MRITKHKTMLDRNQCNVLVKERATNYPSEPLDNSDAVANMINDVFALDKQAEEYFYMIAVNTKNRPVGVFEVSHGTVNASLVSPREVFIRALLIGAVSVFLIHNHPSGDCTPSHEDVLITRRIKEAGKLIGIAILDHVIIGGDDHYSFSKNKLLA